jgi:hypothetical protein
VAVARILAPVVMVLRGSFKHASATARTTEPIPKSWDLVPSVVRCGAQAGYEWVATFFLVMKVSPDAVAMRERKGWTNRCLASGIATRLLLALFNFLEWRGPRAKNNLNSMEQCFGANAGKRRLSGLTLFHDCSMRVARGEPGSLVTELRSRHSLGDCFLH